MGWNNLLRSLSEVAYSVQAVDWSGGKCRGKDRTCHVTTLQSLLCKDKDCWSLKQNVECSAEQDGGGDLWEDFEGFLDIIWQHIYTSIES